MYAEYIRFYKELSKEYGPNIAVFLMVGKFYELYDLLDPATGEGQTSTRRAAELLNIALSTKVKDGPNGEDGLFAGVPEQSLHKYAQVLTKREGWSVAVIDQVKNMAGEVVDRRISRILSPGTHIEAATESGLSIASIWMTPHEPPFAPSWAISIFETTTGECISAAGTATGRHDAWNVDALLHVLQIYSPCEVFFFWRQQQTNCPPSEDTLRSRLGLRSSTPFYFKIATPESEGTFESQFTRHEYMRSMTSIPSMLPTSELLHLNLAPEIVERSLCSVLRILEQHFPSLKLKLTRHTLFQDCKRVGLSNNILEQINFITTQQQKQSQSSILSMFERSPLTPMGRRSIRKRLLNPSSDPQWIDQRLDQVDYFHARLSPTPQSEILQIQKFLRGMYDLDRLHHTIAEGTPTAQTILELEQTYEYLQAVSNATTSTPFAQSPLLQSAIQEYLEKFHSLFSIEKAQRAFKKELTSFFQESVSDELTAIEKEGALLLKEWRELFSKFLFWAQVSTDSLRLEYRDEEWTIRGSRAVLQAVHKRCDTVNGSPLTQVQANIKKSTPNTLTCHELTQLNERLYVLQERLARIQASTAREVCIDLWNCLTEFTTEWSSWISTVDESLALASIAKEQKFTRPKIDSTAAKSYFHAEQLFHPLLMNAQTRLEYVKHTVSLGQPKSARGWLLYGVNASGKSSLMKSVGIATILAQSGSFVPADSMTLAPFNTIYSRIWSQDNLWAGLSSFAVEMTELRDIVKGCGSRSLVLGDEVCSGTESESATALVGATLKWLGEKGSCYLFATHLHDLQKLPFCSDPTLSIEQKPRIRHLRVSIDVARRLVYDRNLYDGAGSSQYGIEVARAMDLPIGLMEDAMSYRLLLGGAVATENAQKSTWNSTIIRRNCEICQHAIVRDLEVHHIHARADGGSNQLRNLIVVCQKCHDAHHAQEIQIGPLHMTSEGPVRSVDTRSISSSSSGSTYTPPPTKKKGKWSEDQVQVIQSTIQQFNAFPLKRILYELEKHDITMSPSTLKKWMV